MELTQFASSENVFGADISATLAFLSLTHGLISICCINCIYNIIWWHFVQKQLLPSEVDGVDLNFRKLYNVGNLAK